MKKSKVFILVCLFCLLAVTISFADEILAPSDAKPTQGPIRKLARGLQNITVGGPLQLFKDVEDTYKDEGLIAAASYGPLKGLVRGLIRFGVGVYETLTFIIPGPENFQPILTDPELFLVPKDK